MTILRPSSTAPADAACPGPHACDLARLHLTIQEHELRERVASLEQDVFWYRALAQAGIHALHHLTRERDRLRARLLDLVTAERALVSTTRAQRPTGPARPDPPARGRRRATQPAPRASEGRIQ